MKQYILAILIAFMFTLTAKSQIVADATVNRFTGSFLQKELMEVKWYSKMYQKTL